MVGRAITNLCVGSAKNTDLLGVELIRLLFTGRGTLP